MPSAAAAFNFPTQVTTIFKRGAQRHALMRYAPMRYVLMRYVLMRYVLRWIRFPNFLCLFFLSLILCTMCNFSGVK